METTYFLPSRERLKQLRSGMQHKFFDAYIIHHLPTIRYLTNFSGSNGLIVVTKRNVHFFTDDRYAEQVKTELFAIEGLKVHVVRDVWQHVAEKNILSSALRVGFEANVVTVETAQNIRKKFKNFRLISATGIARDTTIPKYPHEIASIKKAADIAADVYQYLLGFIKPGMREIDAAVELSYQARKRGSEGDAFEIILVAGDHGAFVHGRATERKIKKGEVITLDFGCRVNGFHSDMTRTFSVGKPPAEAVKAFAVVTDAHRSAIDAIKPGISAKKLDLVARNIITNAGYGDYYKHSLGHGLGIEVHESPAVSHRNEKGTIPENAVITIEPGIYIPGMFGMRLEDDIHVTANGPVSLTTAPREMVII